MKGLVNFRGVQIKKKKACTCNAHHLLQRKGSTIFSFSNLYFMTLGKHEKSQNNKDFISFSPVPIKRLKSSVKTAIFGKRTFEPCINPVLFIRLEALTLANRHTPD